MPSEDQLARWWCSLNGWEWPEDMPKPKPRMTEDEITEVFNALPGRASVVGMRLWRERYAKGLNPVNGKEQLWKNKTT